MIRPIFVAGALAATAAALPVPKSHTDTPGGTVVSMTVPVGQLSSIQEIAHDIWSIKYSNSSKQNLDLNVHVGHDGLEALRTLGGAAVTGTLIDDVHTLVDEQAQARTGDWDREESLRVVGAKADPFFDEYRPNEEIDEYLRMLAEAHSDIAEYVPSIGPSVQGNPIRAIIIGGEDGGPAVYNQCGIHAREWITHTTCMYIIVELLESQDPAIRQLVNQVRFVFVPNGNPDGYIWSWAENGNRLWRENRAVPPASNPTCFGVDLNRNFDAEWNDGPPGCSSSNPCSQTYHGTGPASEAEVEAMQNFAIEIGNTHQYLGAIDWHSFTQLILRPYGYQATPVPPNDAFAEAVGDAMADAIESVHGMSYTNQPSTDLYPVCGCAIDFLYETTLGVTFTMELRPATSGGGGFILPPEQIVPTGEENMAGFVVYSQRILNGFLNGTEGAPKRKPTLY
eukprot:COSAG05_NODE_2893_length_2534_cov_193.227926_1_plen_452_part_00